MILSKKEKVLMEAIYKASIYEGQSIFSSTDILKIIPYKCDFREEDVEKTLTALKIEGYFEFDKALKDDEPVYIIILKDKGKAFLRDQKAARKRLLTKILITIGTAILGYLIKVIISAIVGA